MRKIAIGGLGEFWYGNYKEPFTQLEGAIEGHPQGVVLYDDDGKLLCAYCGKTWSNLGKHTATHGMTARQYREEVGLYRKAALVSEGERIRRLKNGIRLYESQRTTVTARQRRAWAKKAVKARAGVGWANTPEHQNKNGHCYAQILAVARNLQSKTGQVRASALRKHGISDKIVVARFGSLRALTDLVNAPPPHGPGARYSDHELLAALAQLAAQLGRTPAETDIVRFGLPSFATYQRHFGSWAAACKAAGLPPNLPRVINNDARVVILSAYAASGTVEGTVKAAHFDRRRVMALLGSFGIPMPNYATKEERMAWRQSAATIASGLLSE